MPRIIEVIVSPKGETKLQTKGYAGSDCLRASKFLQEALGTSLSESKTAEFYEAAANEEHLRQQ